MESGAEGRYAASLFEAQVLEAAVVAVQSLLRTA
jgi:hypothetical protein